MAKTASTTQVCITGIGAVTPFAGGWANIQAALAEVTPSYGAWGADLRPPMADARLGIIKEFPKERYFNDRQLRLMDKSMSLNTVAAAFAMEDAGLLVDGEVKERDEVGTLLASAQGEAASLYRFGSPLFQVKPAGVNPAHFPMIARNVACGQLAIRFGLRGWSTMIASGDAAGAHALARAAEIVSSGRTHTMVVGAYEVLSQLGLHKWQSRRLKQGRAASDLPIGVNDWVPVEGACFFVVESLQHARERGRMPYAVLDNWQHGYSHGERGQGWAALTDRFLSGCASPAPGRESTYISCLSDTDGAFAHADNAASFESTIQRLRPVVSKTRTRHLFGDARSVNPMYGVAMACQALADGKASDTVVANLTDANAYALFSLSRAAQ